MLDANSNYEHKRRSPGELRHPREGRVAGKARSSTDFLDLEAPRPPSGRCG